MALCNHRFGNFIASNSIEGLYTWIQKDRERERERERKCALTDKYFISVIISLRHKAAYAPKVDRNIPDEPFLWSFFVLSTIISAIEFSFLQSAILIDQRVELIRFGQCPASSFRKISTRRKSCQRVQIEPPGSSSVAITRCSRRVRLSWHFLLVRGLFPLTAPGNGQPAPLCNALFDRPQARASRLYFRPKRKPTLSAGRVTEGREPPTSTRGRFSVLRK